MRAVSVLAIVAAIGAAGCAAASGDTQLVSQASAVHSLTGAWVGRLSDSSGSMMGAGMTPSMWSNATWNVTQMGTTFSGTVIFPAYGGGVATVSGTVVGHTADFTMTLPNGSMTMGGSCMATAHGSFDLDDAFTGLRGTYAGDNSCSGRFDGGTMSMTRR